MTNSPEPSVAECLARYRPKIEEALAFTRGAWTWEAISREVLEGRAMLVVSPSGNSVAVLQPVLDMHVFTASGDMDELMLMEQEQSDRARDAGFDRMTLIGRRGWARQLRKRGWKENPAMALVKDL